jgi:DNA-binding Xre family transcriptional regulator
MELTDDQIERAIEADKVFYAQLAEEIKCYEHLCRGDANELKKFFNLSDMGKLLIALRIFRGFKQSDLAECLGVDPSQVSRDERNEYSGITLQRASKISEALDVQLKCQYEPMAYEIV